MSCSCSLVGLLSSSIPGVFSASLDGSTSIEIGEDSSIVLLGQTISTLNIGAYAYQPGQDPYLGASCHFEASAQIPWVTKYDCFADKTYFIPKSGAKASMTNRVASGVSQIAMECLPGAGGINLSADASAGPATPYFIGIREDGYNLVYTGAPIPVETGRPIKYTISLGFATISNAFLQSFSLSVDPPDVAKVQYSFVFSGMI